jgi:flavin reductase (DIM6/NTAB) family NADH-FMN oxidoreductase RutF
MAKAGSFCVNILSEEQEARSRDFAVSGGDKLTGSDGRQVDGVGWRPGGAPLLQGMLAWVECTFFQAYEAGDQELVLGQVQARRERWESIAVSIAEDRQAGHVRAREQQRCTEPVDNVPPTQRLSARPRSIGCTCRAGHSLQPLDSLYAFARCSTSS